MSDALSQVQFPGFNTRNALPEIVGPSWMGLGMWGGPRGVYGNYLNGPMSQMSADGNAGMGLALPGAGAAEGTYASPGSGQNGESSN